MDPKPWIEDCVKWDTEQRPALIAANRELQAVDLAVLGERDLVEHLRRTADNFQRGMTLHFDLMPAHDIPVGRFVLACRRWGIAAGEALSLLAGSSPAWAASSAELAAIAEACAAVGVDPRSIEDVRAQACRASTRPRGASAALTALHRKHDDHGRVHAMCTELDGTAHHGSALDGRDGRKAQIRDCETDGGAPGGRLGAVLNPSNRMCARLSFSTP